MASTVVIKGMPRDIPVKVLAVHLDKVFNTDDIGTFRVRELGFKYRSSWQAAIDFISSYDAFTAQSILDGYRITFTDGDMYVLNAKVNSDPGLMATKLQHMALEKWQNETSDALVLDMTSKQMEECNAALDLKLGLLKKQKLILQTERELLEEKRRLEREYKKGLETEESIIKHRPRNDELKRNKRKSSRSYDRDKSPGTSKLPKSIVSKSYAASLESIISKERNRSSPNRALDEYSKTNRLHSPDSERYYRTNRLLSPDHERCYRTSRLHSSDSERLYRTDRRRSPDGERCNKTYRLRTPDSQRLYRPGRRRSPDGERCNKTYRLHTPDSERLYRTNRRRSPDGERCNKTYRLRTPDSERLCRTDRRRSSDGERIYRFERRRSPEGERIYRTERRRSPDGERIVRLHSPVNDRYTPYQQSDFSLSKERDRSRSRVCSRTPYRSSRWSPDHPKSIRRTLRSSSPEHLRRRSPYRSGERYSPGLLRMSYRRMSRSRSRSRYRSSDKSQKATVTKTRYDKDTPNDYDKTLFKYQPNMNITLKSIQPAETITRTKIQEIVDNPLDDQPVPETHKTSGVVVKDEKIEACDDFKIQINAAIRKIMVHYQILVNKITNKSSLQEVDQISILKIWQSILSRRIRSLKLNSFMMANDIVCEYMSAYTERDDSVSIQKLIDQIQLPKIEIEDTDLPQPSSEILEDTADSKIWFIVDEVFKDIELDYFADNDDADTIVLEQPEEFSTDNPDIKIECRPTQDSSDSDLPKSELFVPQLETTTETNTDLFTKETIRPNFEIKPKLDIELPNELITTNQSTHIEEQLNATQNGVTRMEGKKKRKKGPINKPDTTDWKNRKIPKKPKFVLPVKNILKTMKPHILELGGDMNVKRILDITTFEIRKNIMGLVAGKGYMKSAEITELYRQKYPIDTEFQFVLDLLEKIKSGVYNCIKDSQGNECTGNFYNCEVKCTDSETANSPADDDVVIIVENHDVIILSEDEDGE